MSMPFSCVVDAVYLQFRMAPNFKEMKDLSADYPFEKLLLSVVEMREICDGAMP